MGYADQWIIYKTSSRPSCLGWFLNEFTDALFDMINAVHYDKPSIFIVATFREKLVLHALGT